jgi:peptidyl-tRNA hydrolase, PTH1 family
VKAVVGLGNPGKRYVKTRHNVGFWVVDHLASDVVWQQEASYLWAAYRNDANLLLVKPTTYMNNSGIAVVDLAEKFDLVPKDILVIVDDIHLDVGRLRFRRGGSHGGHNGLRSIVSELNTSDFPRLRVGVGHPSDPEDLIGHVLGVFLSEELDEMDVTMASSGVLSWFQLGIETAMNQFN